MATLWAGEEHNRILFAICAVISGGLSGAQAGDRLGPDPMIVVDDPGRDGYASTTIMEQGI